MRRKRSIFTNPIRDVKHLYFHISYSQFLRNSRRSFTNGCPQFGHPPQQMCGSSEVPVSALHNHSRARHVERGNGLSDYSVRLIRIGTYTQGVTILQCPYIKQCRNHVDTITIMSQLQCSVPCGTGSVLYRIPAAVHNIHVKLLNPVLTGRSILNASGNRLFIPGYHQTEFHQFLAVGYHVVHIAKGIILYIFND